MAMIAIKEDPGVIRGIAPNRSNASNAAVEIGEGAA
jgi:hypothetical protein